MTKIRTRTCLWQWTLDAGVAQSTPTALSEVEALSSASDPTRSGGAAGVAATATAATADPAQEAPPPPTPHITAESPGGNLPPPRVQTSEAPVLLALRLSSPQASK